MPKSSPSAMQTLAGRQPPYSEEAERGVLGSLLLDAQRVVDMCVESQLVQESFYVPAHRLVYEASITLTHGASVIDILTVGEQLRSMGKLEVVGGPAFLETLIDSTPTAAHAEYYIDIVRQKHLLRSIIDCARTTETECFSAEDSADSVLSRAEQAFLDISDNRHGNMVAWRDSVKNTMAQIEQILDSHRGLTGLSSGYLNIDNKLQGLRNGEMIVLAARPSMGKTSLAMNIVEHVSLGQGDPDRKAHGVGIFSLEMSCESLVMRMLCSRSKVRSFDLARGTVASGPAHGELAKAASVLMKAPIFLDDTGGLDVMELRARARRMKKRHDIDFIVIDYLQLLNSRDYAKQGRQIETSNVSANLKSMAKELNVPVLVLSQLSRAPEQRDKTGKPKLSDLRDSGAIEQDADVVLMLRRPSRYEDDPEHDDKTLSVLDVVKHRNGPVGEVYLNFIEEYTRFEDRQRSGVDDMGEIDHFVDDMGGVTE